MTPISVVIIAKNEQANIHRCLSSLTWADEVVLVDSGSEDSTILIAQRFPNVHIVMHPWKGYVENKNIGIQSAKHPWILWVDSDEELSESMKSELLTLSSEQLDRMDAFSFPRKTFLMGKWIRHCGWYPGRVVRLFKKDKVLLSDDILHEKMVIPDGALTFELNGDILHYSYRDLKHFFQKMAVYGEYAALNLQKKGVRFSWWKLVFHPIFAFLKFYIFQLGFLDGIPGLIVCGGGFFANFIKWSSFYYLQRSSERNYGNSG